MPTRSACRALKRRARTQQARQQETEDAPQIELTVLEGRARQHDAVLRADRETGLRNFRVRILDELALVEHRVAELRTRQHGPVFAQLRIAREPNDRVFSLGKIMPGLEHIDGELREKFRDLFAPHRHHAGGAHDQMRLAGNRAGREQGQHLMVLPSPISSASRP